MKRKIIYFVMLCLFVLPTSLFALESLTKSTYTASVDFSGFVGEISVDVVCKDIKTDVAKSSFTFTPAAGCLNAGTTWYTANEYLIIYTTWTMGSNGKLLIYTDNTSADADPRYVGSDNPAGLVCSTGTISSASPLSLCWRVVDDSTDTINIGYTVNGSTMSLYSIGMATDYYTFLFVKDKGYDGNWYNDDNSYAAIKTFNDNGNRIQHGENTFSSTASPDYLYLGCNFEKARGSRTYKTNTLRIDLVTE